MKKLTKQSFFSALGIVFVLFLLASPSVYFYMKYQESETLLKNPTAATQQQVKDIVTKLAVLMELPKNEDPTIATVLDKNKLKDQAFFAHTENGDKVVIYSKAQKAILYRLSTNNIIEVAPINLGSSTSSQPIPVVLYNGTTTTGLTTALETELKSTVTGISVVDKSNAKKIDYERTVVVDLAGTHATEAKQLADYLNGDVGSLPSGEVVPDASLKAGILIIIGKNFTVKPTATPAASPSAAPSGK